ncbi:hypothetical protein C7999DRAFT_15033 [Corynascus novoguineensis]|uniref:Uncharacterized protein n=1 Tax=Corynascus novoguineensis TaxID=1126955 RepID=A0AAN7CRB0_9PEZI|nr:hypothetical protein C7999DRAFT_15033 [Corynascus novoguineensis]
MNVDSVESLKPGPPSWRQTHKWTFANSFQSQALARLQHSYALSPITALVFYEAAPDQVLLLAGEDTWLKVYDVQTCRLLGQLRVFKSQPIHGIYVSKSQRDGHTKLLIWGGHSVALLPHSSLQTLITGRSAPAPPVELHAPDWIYDGLFFPDTDLDSAEVNTTPTTSGVLVTAHNEILPLSSCSTPDPSHPGGFSFGPLTSPSRPILYSASLALLSPPSRQQQEQQQQQQQQQQQRPGGAAGPSPAGNGGNGPAVALLDGARETGFGGGGGAAAACSNAAGDDSQGENSEARGRDSAGDSARCVAVAMGHVSRIWHVKFGRALRGSESVEVYSFGEDCSRQKWELDLAPWRRSGSKRTMGALYHRGTSTCHSGKNIWSAAVLKRGENEPLAATGGADGKIVVSGRLRGVGSAFGAYEDLDISLTFDDILRQTSSTELTMTERPTKKATKHAFQRYAFLSETVLAATASGRLFLATMGESLVWTEAPASEAIVADLKSYNVVKSPEDDTAIIGSATGKKISDIVLLNDRTNNGQPWSVLVNVLGLDHAVLLHFDPSTNAATLDTRKVRLPEHYIVTAAVFCNDTLILGSRTGSLTVYTTDPETKDFIPLVSRKDCKTKDAITCILPIPGTPASQISFLTTCRDGKYRVYNLTSSLSTAGLSLQHEISPPLNTLEGAFFTASGPPSSHHFSGSSNNNNSTNQKTELILHGFHGPNFITYNDSARSIISSIPCGGAHRPFATVSCPYDPGQMRFVFSKAGELHIVSQSAEGERVVRPGGHGREIKSVSSAPFSPASAESRTPPAKEDVERTQGGGQVAGEGTSGEALIATAAEDTTIRIWRHQHQHQRRSSSSPAVDGDDNTNGPSPMTCLAILQGHSAGIQALRFAGGGSRLVSSAGSQELFVWRVSRVDSAAYDALAVVREAVWDDNDDDQHDDNGEYKTLPDRDIRNNKNKDLRIVDFDVASRENAAALEGASRETRGEGTMLITMGLSDSSVRTYLYHCPPPSGSGPDEPSPSPSSPSSSQGRFELVARGRYTGACPTQVRHLRADITAADTGDVEAEVHLLTAFTDGHVAVWTAQKKRGLRGSSELALAQVVRLHQNSIKSLDLSFDNTTTGWLVATGGDDNALGLLDLAWDAAERVYVVRGRFRVKDAHAAAVTGLAVVRHAEPGVAEIATASNDQRVKLWRADRKIAAGGMRVALLDNKYSSVADAGDLELVGPGKLMVGGVGMELWDVSRGVLE